MPNAKRALPDHKCILKTSSDFVFTESATINNASRRAEPETVDTNLSCTYIFNASKLSRLRRSGVGNGRFGCEIPNDNVDDSDCARLLEDGDGPQTMRSKTDEDIFDRVTPYANVDRSDRASTLVDENGVKLTESDTNSDESKLQIP